MYQSASLVRQLLQTKDKFPLQNHYATLQHNSIKNSTCLFLGLVFTKPVVSHIFFCKNKQGKTDDISISKMHLRPGKRKYQILMYAVSNFLLCFGEAITDFFLCLAVHDDRRVCIFLAIWYFSDVTDWNYKPYTVRKAGYWGKNINFQISVQRCVCMCIYVCVCIYVYSCMY